MIALIRNIIDGRRWWILLLALLMLFTGLRSMKIDADAPQDLSISAAVYTDEGFKTYSSRNRHLFGGWRWTTADQYKSWYRDSPVPAYLYIAWFKIFGVSFASIRMISVVFSLLTMILLFFMVKRYYDIYTAFAALTLFGFNHFLMMYGRMAFYETYLLFFLVAGFFALWELFRRIKRFSKRFSEKKDGLIMTSEFIMMALCLSVCIASVLAGFYTKQSINIVFISIFPFLLLYSFYSHHRLNSFVVHAFYGIVITIAVSYILAGHFGFFEIWFRDHLSVRIFNIPLKNLLPLKTSVSNFDPVYISFAKSLYLEYVYNQPITFFTGIYMAILTYYRFLYLSRCSKLDLTLASWLLFGFVFLSIMKYHPDRYYLLISIPLIILSARFFVTRDYVNLVELTRKLKIQSFMFVIYLFWFYFVFYAGIVLFLNTIPFYVRKEWYNFIYFSFAKGRTADAIPLVAAVLLFQVIMFVLIVPRIKLLKEKLVSRKIFTTVFVILLVFDIFLHVKWLATSRNHLHELSVRIGEALPENSVLVGGWAPDLTLENGLRSLVIQGELNYNTGVVDTLVKGREVRVLEMKKGKKSEKYEGRMPVYLLISTNAPFEKKMRTVYRKYMKSANRIFSTEMGYFNVDMYRLDAPAGRERVLLKNYIDEYNRRNSSLWKKLIGVNLSDEERDKTEDISGQEPG